MSQSSEKLHQQGALAVQSSTGLNASRICMTCQTTFGGELSHCPDDASLLVNVDLQSLVGTMVGKYKILSVLGQGGMGVVYKAEQIIMQRTVALKMIRSGVIDSSTVLRFQQEAKAALDHPNIVTIYDCSVSDDGSPYLAMEYVDGKILDDDELKLTLDQKLEIFIQLCEGLAYAHDEGVIHRDLKPGNIVLANWSDAHSPIQVKILDFGIAKLLPSSGKQFLELTRTGQPIGSPSYMSPEQCRAEDLDRRSDIYSLGCVMYRMLTGKPAFDGESLFAIFDQHLNEQPQPFSKVCPGIRIPIEIEEIVFKALEKKPANRYQSMRELQEAIRSFKNRPGMGSTAQFLSMRIKRAVRYRSTTYVTLIVLVGCVVSAVIFAANFRQIQMQWQRQKYQSIVNSVNICSKQANEMLKRGDKNGAIAQLRQAVELESRLEDTVQNRRARARSLENLIILLNETGKYADVEPFQQAYIKLLSGELHENKLPLANQMLILSNSYSAQGKFKQASEEVLQAKNIALKFAGPDKEEFANCLAHEGAIYESQGDRQSAYKCYADALKIRQKLFGAKDLRCRRTYEFLAHVSHELGNATEAEQWSSKAKGCR